MRRFSGALAFVAGATLVATAAGAALGQEDPPPEGMEAAEAAAEMAEPSTLEIIDVAGDKTANKPLRGKKLKQAIAKSAPVAARYQVNGMGEDPVGRIIGLSLAARAADEAGNAKAGAALIDIARLLYRNAWTSAKTQPAALNATIEEAVAARGLTGDAALLQQAIWDRWIDICYDPNGPWFGVNEENPASCADEGGTPIRADFAGIEPDANTRPEEVELVDAGGLGIHKVTMHKTANDKLAGKKFKKAWGKALQQHGPAIVSLQTGGPEASTQHQIVELVLAAREADEADNTKAARAFMDLALATYRSAVPKPAEGMINTEALNSELAQLIAAEYADLPGLQMVTPEGFVSVCYDAKKQKCYQSAGDHTPWECAGGNIEFTRMPYEDALAANCPEVE